MAYRSAIMLALVAPTVAAAPATVSYNDKLKEALPDFEMPATWQISLPRFGSLAMYTLLEALIWPRTSSPLQTVIF